MVRNFVGSGQFWSYLSELHCWGRLCRSRLDLSPLCVCSTNLPTKAMKPAQQTIQMTHVTWSKQNCYVKTFASPPLSKMFTCEYPRTTCRVVVNDVELPAPCFCCLLMMNKAILEDNRYISTQIRFCCIRYVFLSYMKVYWMIIASYLCLSHSLHPKYTS